MTDPVEFHAETVEEALDRAAASLGVSPADINFEVLDPGSAGFLGIGAREARILVRRSSVPAPTPQTPAPIPDTPENELLATPAPVSSTPQEATVAVSEETLAAVREFIAGILDKMGLTCTLEVYDNEEYIAADITCDEAGLLIGHKAETIDAIEYLANVAVYRKRPYEKKVIVDSAGYRERRKEAIQGMAHRAARKAVLQKTPFKMPPMRPAERRIVHLFLKDNPEVITSSEGIDENRRIVITPLHK